MLRLCLLSKEKKWRRIMYVIFADFLFLAGEPNFFLLYLGHL